MEYQDRSLVCVECGQQFIFTAGEQEFYARKGFKEEPKRCRPCREARKTRGPQGGRQDDRVPREAGARAEREGEERFPKEERAPRGEGGRRSGREMFDAVCAECGNPTRVPFRPTAGRPVYCRDCYARKRGEGG